MYRTIDTAIWDDPWFAELAPEAKLLFVYLITNRRANASGAYELTERQIVFEIGYPYPIDTLWIALRDRVRWYPNHQIVWVRNFYRHNCHSPKMTISARKHVARLPEEIRREIVGLYPDLGNPDDPPPIPYAYPIDTLGIKEEVKVEVKEQATATARARAREDELPTVTVRSANGATCLFAAAVGEKRFTTIAEQFASVNVQLDRHWLEQTLIRYESQNLSLPPPQMRAALKAAFLQSQDAFGREGNRISNPRGWVATQIKTAIREQEAKAPP